MRIVVIGASRLGVALVEELLEHDFDVVLVDQSRERLDELSDELECGFIHGDGTLPRTQRDAYGDSADALMLMTNHDDVNILGAVVGRSIGYERIVLQIVRAQFLAVCDELGFDDVVTPHVTVAGSIVHSLEHDERVWSQLGVAEGLHFTTYSVPKSLEDSTLADVELPQGARAIAVLRGSDDIDLAQDTALKEGDEVLVAAKRDVRKGLGEVFTDSD
ncbi:potassium channel family protein [Anianabacter salinae]|uniref:potassium channel family protein n=1 Tax=Anianabacter salinae TaxID=2851023 RepID=UPI00225E5F9A|nr:TrkA family potassium uptake protein [Anianabacter salinae]MBV0911194.1 TrkA family potassium uptake protein [Anianabacter salinae]